MANTIDQLDFDVILHDDKFNTKVQEILKVAGGLNTDLSKILTINAKLQTKQIISSTGVANAKEMVRALEEIQSKINSMSGTKMLVGDADKLNETLTKVLEKMEKMEKGGDSIKNGVKGINAELMRSHGLMNELSRLTGVALSVEGLRSFLTGLVKISGEFEVQKMALTSMLQSADKADEIFNTLRENALESPYTFQDLTKYAKQLTAFNIDVDNLVETEKRLADVSAGLGVDMGRIILAYGQVKAAGVLKGTELRQFTEAGVPLLQSLADQIKETEGKAISLSEVFSRISKKQIPFEMVEEAFRRMTDEGGKFYNMQEVLVSTLQGKIGKLRDVWQQALYDIGQSNSQLLKGTVDWVTNIVSNLDKMGDELGSLIIGFGAYGASLALIGGLTSVAFGIKTILNIKAVATELWAAASAAGGLSAAMGAIKAISIAIAAVAAVATLVATKIRAAREEQERYNESIAECTKSLNQEYDNLDRLKKVAGDEKKSMDERKKAIDLINQQYGTYLSNMGAEKVSVDNLTTSYNNLRDAIGNKFLEQLKENTVGAERKKVNDAENELLKFNVGLIGKSAKDDPRKLARLTASVQSYLSNIAPRSDQGDIFRVLSRIYGDEGIVFNQRQAGKINELAENYVVASKRLKTAEKNFGTFADEYSQSMGFVIKTTEDAQQAEEITPSTWGDNQDKNNNKAIQRAKDNINTTIDSIKELQRAYKDFKTMGLDDETILKLFGDDKMFGYLPSNLRNRLDYWDMLLEQADKMEKYDPNDAKGIRADVARGQADQAKKDWEDNQKAIKASYKELEKYGKAMDKWFAKDYSTSGQGFSNDVNKILTDYQTKQNEADLEASHRREELYASEAAVRDQYLKDHKDASEKEVEEYWKGYAKAGEAAILLLLGKQKEANRVAAQENINDLANKAVKDATKGMSLTDWGDKSIGQVYGLYKELSGLAGTNNIDLSAKDSSGRTLEQRIKSAGLSIKDFKNLTKEAFDKLSDEAKEELQKKVGALVKEVAQDFLSCADSIKTFAEASGNLELAATISDLEEVGSLISTIAQRAMQGDWIGAVTSYISFMVKQIFAAKTEIAELQARISEAAEESRTSRLKDALSVGVDSIFGSNELQKAQNAVDTISELRKSMDGYASDINSMRFNKRKFGFFESTWAAALGLGKYETQSIGEMAKAVEGDLYDAYGNLNADTLQAILDTYDKLDAEQRRWIERAIHDSETYAEAMEQIDDVAESILGNVVSDVADKMVDSWWEAGEAALDYADILGDVAKAYAKLIVQDMLMDAAFDDNRQKEFKDALKNGDASKAMAVVEQAMASAESMLPAVNAALQAFEPYRTAAQEAIDSSSNSVGTGIKGITEDTANLLASYINAIRADVSYLRVMQEKGWQGVATIGEAIPTLNDYMNQIAANTYDTAQNTQSILSEIQSVIGAPGTSGMVVRVESY